MNMESLVRVVFVFDRVAHYHRELFRALECELPLHGMEVHLLSGVPEQGGKGRVGLADKVVENEQKYEFREFHVGSFTFRRHIGVLEWLENNRPEIVVVLGHVGNISHWGLISARRRLGFKLVAWQCGYEYNKSWIKDRLLGYFVPGFDFHLAYHSNARRYALEHGCPERQVVVVHNTINEEKVELLPRDEARARLRRRHPEVGESKIVLFVGAVLAEKRVEALVEAMDRLARKDAVLIVVGDGEHLGTIRELAVSRPWMILPGAVLDGVGMYFDAAEVYVLPGTGGLGINEAMAHGLPIVSGFADGSADDLVVDGVNGFRLRGGTSEEIAGCIEKILEDPSLAAQMGRRSREMIRGFFSFRSFLSRIVGALEGIKSGGPGPLAR